MWSSDIINDPELAEIRARYAKKEAERSSRKHFKCKSCGTEFFSHDPECCIECNKGREFLQEIK